MFAVHQHLRAKLSSFQPVTIEEVWKLLSGIPSKSHHSDVLPCSLLKSCSRVRASHCQTRQPVTADSKSFCPNARAQLLRLLDCSKAGLDISQPSNYRPISNLPTVSKVLERLVLARLQPTCSAQSTSASSSLHHIFNLGVLWWRHLVAWRQSWTWVYNYNHSPTHYCYYYVDPLMAFFPGQPGYASTRKSGFKWGKRWWGFVMQWHQLDHMQTVCTSLQTDSHNNTSSPSAIQWYQNHF